MSQAAEFWPVKIRDDVTVCVTPDLQQMTSYVLLEQEDWFEDEMPFIRDLTRNDTHALDIGANHGVYALSIARHLTAGHVWAVEPTSAPGNMLARSIALNGWDDRITLVRSAFSNSIGSAEMAVSLNSELNSLGGATDRTETIRLDTLDNFMAQNAIEGPIDFVKLDAEGEEVRILDGGRTFFTGQSPLVMFELRHGSEVNHGLIDGFRAFGYEMFRLLPDMNVLVDYDPAFDDGYLLNLFACKSDRADLLGARGLLVRRADIDAAKEPIAADWSARLGLHAYADGFPEAHIDNLSALPADYAQALSACLQAQDRTLASAARVARLEQALDLVTALVAAGETHPAIQLLQINLLHHMGYRTLSWQIAQQVAAMPAAELAALAVPFVLPSPVFYDRQVDRDQWLAMILQEFVELRRTFSSYFSPGSGSRIGRLAQSGPISPALTRRLALTARKSGTALAVPVDHGLTTEDRSVNASIWRILLQS